MRTVMTNHQTLIDLASIDGPPLAAIHGPDEPVESLTGSGVTLTGGRNVCRIGHSPDVLGSQSTSGTPTGWGDGPIDTTALPRTDTVVRRTSKGRTTYRASKYVPQHRRTVGTEYALDHVTGEPTVHVSCSRPDEHGSPITSARDGRWLGGCDCNTRERGLVSAADRILSAGVGDDERRTLRLLNPVGRECHPQVIPGDRSSVGMVQDGHAASVGGVIVSNGDLGAYFGIRGLENAKVIRTNETKGLTWRTRSVIGAANRLHTAKSLERHALASFGSHRIADVALWARERRTVRVIGRRTATATELVTFCDVGWFVGHQYHAPSTRRLSKRQALIAKRRTERYGEPTASTVTPPADGVRTSDALTLIRAMAVGETLHGITRTSVGRWTYGTDVLTPGRAADVVRRALMV